MRAITAQRGYIYLDHIYIYIYAHINVAFSKVKLKWKRNVAIRQGKGEKYICMYGMCACAYLSLVLLRQVGDNDNDQHYFENAHTYVHLYLYVARTNFGRCWQTLAIVSGCKVKINNNYGASSS